jgi:chemotaxis protein methyltransferase CheR
MASIANKAASAEREFKFTDRDFNFVKNLVGEQTGIVLSEAKRNMVYSRLARRLRALDLVDFKDYLGLLKENDQTELVNFVNAITTNLTAFFRENHHFDYLANQLIPHLLKKNAHTHRLRIWSAGCSTGEEPYSIAITLKEAIPNIKNWDVKILATDLDTNVVETASTGVYTEERVSGISKPRLKKWFKKGRNGTGGMVKVSPELQELITFKQLNLMHDWPFKGPFDLIFCRNVVIYFSKDTQRTLVERYHKVLDDEGHLFLGHSESLFKVSTQFDLIGNTIYKKFR